MHNTSVVSKPGVTRGSEPFALRLYRRILVDLQRPSTPLSANSKVKTWKNLLLQARQEGLLNRSESAAILKWIHQRRHLPGTPPASRPSPSMYVGETD